ncbi:MAG: GDSL-type esterase/lipase family protein [Bacteroidia bacterium]|nr:GDSL-type esterase/lipase family protein [Bacteroidia bacterium]
MQFFYRSLSFFLLVLFSLTLSLAQENQKKENPLARLEKEVQAFEAKDKESAPPEDPILLVGSSSVRFWMTMKKDLAPLRVMNRGFGGSTFPELLYYYDRLVKPYSPKAILVYEGDNDLLMEGMTPENVLNNMKSFYSRVQNDFPGVKVWFISIKPSIARANLLETMQESNRLVKAYAAQTEHMEFLDVASPMLNEDGSIKDDIFVRDNLHMNAKGYAIWTKIIHPALLKEYSKKGIE